MSKRVWKAMFLWLSFGAVQDGKIAITQTVMVTGGRENGRYVTVNMTSKQARDLAVDLVRFADIVDRLNREML